MNNPGDVSFGSWKLTRVDSEALTATTAVMEVRLPGWTLSGWTTRADQSAPGDVLGLGSRSIGTKSPDNRAYGDVREVTVAALEDY